MTVLFPVLPGNDSLEFLAGDMSLPVTDVSIRGNVDGQGVVWVVAVEFENLLGETAEGTFTIPLPHSGAVTGMKMVLGDRTVVADIKERDQARVEYREAVAAGRSAALFEQNRAEIFSISVGNVLPGEAIRVEVTVHDAVTIDGCEATLRMPTMIKTRYVPEGVDDAHDISAPTVSARTFAGGNVHIEFSSQADDLVCDTTDAAQIDGASVTINGFPLTSDIVLRWRVPATIAAAKWVPDNNDPDMGTLEVTIRVEKKPNVNRRRKAVQIMLDNSGSMSGHYMEWARRIVNDTIALLTPEDMIHVLTFNSRIDALRATESGFVAVTNTVKQNLNKEIAGITARGGTELTSALQACGAVLSTLDDIEDSDEFERLVLLITDGAYGDEASAAYHRENELKDSRVIAVAIGENANGYLEVLASNGICVYVPSESTLSESAAKVLERIDSLALQGVRVAGDDLTCVAPSTAPDVYPDLVKTISGRMPRPASDAEVRIESKEGHVMTLPIVISDDASATTRWASSYIKSLDYEMMSRVDNDSASNDLEKRIVALSIKYKVLSKYTAWLAVDKSRPGDEAVLRKVVFPRSPLLDAVRHAHSHTGQAHSVHYLSLHSVPGDSWDFEPNFLDPKSIVSTFELGRRDLEAQIATIASTVFPHSETPEHTGGFLRRWWRRLFAFLRRRRKRRRR